MSTTMEARITEPIKIKLDGRSSYLIISVETMGKIQDSLESGLDPIASLHVVARGVDNSDQAVLRELFYAGLFVYELPPRELTSIVSRIRNMDQTEYTTLCKHARKKIERKRGEM